MFIIGRLRISGSMITVNLLKPVRLMRNSIGSNVNSGHDHCNRDAIGIGENGQTFAFFAKFKLKTVSIFFLYALVII